MKEKTLKKKEIIFIAAILLIAFAMMGILYLMRLRNRGQIENAHIYVNGEDYGSYSLSVDQVIEVNDTNVCEIKDGKIQMTDASCPDQLCIYQGAIDDNGGMIVCLPNAVIITSDRSETDD
jgi:hypothetical protein